MSTLVNTRGNPVPYITVAELRRAPIYGQLQALVPNSSAGDRDAELGRIIARASGMINDEVNQNLAATVDTEIAEVVVDPCGNVRLPCRSNPIISVSSIAVGWDPTSLVSLTDLSTLILDPWRITIPRATLLGVGLNLRPRRRLWAQWQYVNGFPVTTLATAASAGDTTVTVANATGIVAGSTYLSIEDGRLLEQFIPTAVNGNVLTLPAPLANAHLVGTGVTNLPDALKECTLLLISRLHDTWSLTMNLITNDGSGAKRPSGGKPVIMCDAANILQPYKRIL